MVLIGLYSGCRWVEVEDQTDSMMRRHLLQIQTLGIVIPDDLFCAKHDARKHT